MLRTLCLFAVAMITLTTPGTAWADRRVALVIGNSAYTDPSAPVLANPVNDAQLVAGALRQAGFEVDIRTDRDHNEFHEELELFSAKARRADVALIYYAGHGLEAVGKNWLIPTDYRAKRAADLRYDAIDMEEAVRSLAGAKLKVLILDACRENPWARRLRESTSSVTIGLASLTPSDSIVIYSAAPGTTADDGVGRRNSPFATAFAKDILLPQSPIQNLGPHLRDDVLESTQRRQSPFTSLNVTAAPYYLCTESEPCGTRAIQPIAEATPQVETPTAAAGRVLKICRSFYRAPVATYRASIDWGTAPPPQVGKRFVLAVKDTSVESQSGMAIYWVQASYQSFHGKGREAIEFNVSDGPLYPFIYGIYEVEEMAFRAYRDDCRQNQARCFVTGYAEGPNLLTNTLTLVSAQETPDCQAER
jgi:hypothetical protein